MLTLGSLGVWLFYLIVGNHSLGLQVSGEVDILEIVASVDTNHAVIAGLDALPLGGFAIAAFLLVAIVFTATTYDSASYPGGQCNAITQTLRGSREMAPRLLGDWIDDSARRSHVRRWLRAQKVTLVASIPLVVTFWLSGLAFFRSLQADHKTS